MRKNKIHLIEDAIYHQIKFYLTIINDQINHQLLLLESLIIKRKIKRIFKSLFSQILLNQNKEKKNLQLTTIVIYIINL